MSKKEKKPDKYDEKVKIDIPAGWGFDDTLKAIVDSKPDVKEKAVPKSAKKTS